ncbi:putative RNA dependent RNA polymerase [Cassava virus C]|uniref:Putative RNA dependent RNA polymerase n=1 Tax=Cassava virus C TaxID=561576 RepID=B5U1W6_9VIRU|nr:putative RNA dependent RNA polymerase [Cassava virus C]ACI03053.1 putative RNA dependent RNA polymerase [Cassava virus C]
MSKRPLAACLSVEETSFYAKTEVSKLCGLVDRMGKLPRTYAGDDLPIDDNLKPVARSVLAPILGTRLTRERTEYICSLSSQLVVGISDVTYILLGSALSVKEIRWQSQLFAILAIAGKLEAAFKSHTGFLLATCLGDRYDSPDPSSSNYGGIAPGRIFPPRFQRKIWMRCVLRRRPQDVTLASSLVNIKRVAPPVPDSFVQESLNKNRERLSKPQSDCPDPILDMLERQVVRTVDEIVYNAKKEGWNRKIARSAFPSQSASFARSIASGGQLGEIVPENWSLRFPTLLAMVERCQEVVPIYGWHESPETVLTENLRGHIDACLEVRRSPVLEPFKVRTITMGPAEPYFKARRIQGVLWDLLKHTRCTHLPNRPIHESDISFFCSRRGDAVFPDEETFFVSGDYSAATDCLSPVLSTVAVDRLCDHLLSPENQVLDPVHPWRALFHRVLVGHKIMEGKRGEEVEIAAQTWGQLMGSPLSFPILCIVNLAITRASIEHTAKRQLYLEECGILVNGDDILFKLPLRGLARWDFLVTRGGLHPSPGKNFVSKDYAVLNSTIYRVGRTAELIPTIKGNLINGTACRGIERPRDGSLYFSDASKYSWGTIGDRARELIKGFPNHIADQLLSRFLISMKPHLDLFPRISWWAHPQYGGLGLPVTRPGDFLPVHRRVGAFLACGGRRSQEFRMNMQWLSNPVKQFNAFTSQYLMDIARSLSVPVKQIYNDETEPEFFLEREIMYSALRFGVEFPTNARGNRELLAAWRHFYRQLERRALRTRITDGDLPERKADRKGLFLLSPEKLIAGPRFKYVYDWACKNQGGNIWSSSSRGYVLFDKHRVLESSALPFGKDEVKSSVSTHFTPVNEYRQRIFFWT